MIFFAGDYLDTDGEPIKIEIDVIVADLNEEQQRHFCSKIRWWDTGKEILLGEPPPEATDRNGVLPAIHVVFEGMYDKEEDDFTGETYFQSVKDEDNEKKDKFKVLDKRKCGFILLRSIRTGTRALSLERGSLLDIILNLEDNKLDMWERILAKLREIRADDCSDEDSGSEDDYSNKNNPPSNMRSLLAGIHEKLMSLVPSHWGGPPEMKVSDLTRESLRRTINVFMETGVKNIKDGKHIAPFKKQGDGTVNMLLLAMLSMIAERKQNVIFAMEEPETAIPPYTQKNIINGIRESSNQTLVTSHSPFVLEEYNDSEIVALANDSDGEISSIPFKFPAKKNTYRRDIRQKYCEALLARRVLIVEGKTEYDAITVVARRLQEIDRDNFSSLESLGIAVIDAEGDGEVPKVASSLQKLGKTVFAIYDKQEDNNKKKEIRKNVEHPFESPEKGFEALVVNYTDENRLKEFFNSELTAFDPLKWKKSLIKDLIGKKGFGCAADLLVTCKKDEMPEFITSALSEIKRIVEPKNTVLSASENNSPDK